MIEKAVRVGIDAITDGARVGRSGWIRSVQQRALLLIDEIFVAADDSVCTRFHPVTGPANDGGAWHRAQREANSERPRSSDGSSAPVNRT